MFAGPELQVVREDAEAIHGELRWPSEPDCREEIRWDQAVDDLPSLTCYRLMSLIEERKLLDIDMISVPRSELQALLTDHIGSPVDAEALESALQQLKAIEVARIEDGEGFDSFFVHE